MRTFIKRHVLAATAAMVVLAGGVGVAIAQSGGEDAGDPAQNEAAPGSSTASPESGQRGVGIPEGPFVDFCPTPSQIEAHEELYPEGGDYKPIAVTCGGPSHGERDDPPFGLSEEEFQELLREDGQPQLKELSRQERRDYEAGQAANDQREKQALLNARWDNRKSGTCDYHGVLPDGREVVLETFGCPPDDDVYDAIEDLYGP